MVFFSDGIDMSAKFGGVFKTFSQAVSGEALVKVSYVNQAGQPGYVALTPNQPSRSVYHCGLAIERTSRRWREVDAFGAHAGSAWSCQSTCARSRVRR